MKIPPRTLSENQCCQVWVYDITSNRNSMLLETTELLLEAPNWNRPGDALILNGNGVLWHLDLASRDMQQIDIQGVPPLNNDHVLDPDGEHIFLSAYDDWQIYRAPLKGGKAKRITGKEGPPGLFHFLHGVSPDGQQLSFVGVAAEDNGKGGLNFLSADIYTIAANGTDYRKITSGGPPSDGPEYSVDGTWLYFNTELFSKNAQIARMRPDGCELQRLVTSNTVDWFPHPAPDGKTFAYLAFPPETKGHPADLWVELMLVENHDWSKPRSVVKLFGGQGTINVNSWSPDSTRFAYVAYPKV